MSPGTLPPRPPRRLAIALRTPASERRTGFLPATTPTPSTGVGVGTDNIIQLIGRIRSRVRGETGARVRWDDTGRLNSHCRGTPSTKRRLDDSPYAATTAPKSKRARAGAAEERTVDVTGCITSLVRGETRRMPSKRRLDDSPLPYSSTTTPGSKRRRADATERPVEVIGRIRNLTAGASALEVLGGGTTVRVHGGAGGGVSCRRDFTLDGVSVAEEEGLEAFYGRFVRSRVEGVRAGAKCTVIVYGPTVSGKSHTMFGCAEEPGVMYRALWDLLGGGGGEDGSASKYVKVYVLEIYNEDVYDLLDGSVGSNASGNTPNPKTKVRLDAMGTKATHICGNEAGKIAREVAKVEKRRAKKSTGCNARSSRSHCMIILDVPSVGGRLMLVDMAGSENIEAAGRTEHDAKSEFITLANDLPPTRSINRGNTTLKRVVQSIANGDAYVPFRDSKLTMLLRDSFDDDRSKILMILCASPDLEQLHKTISTLEYGARAKSITRAADASTPKDKMSSSEAQILLKDDELARLRVKLSRTEAREAAIIAKVTEQNQILRGELRTMEEQMLTQRQELLAVKQRLLEVEWEKLDMEGESHLAWRVLKELGIFLQNLGWRKTAACEQSAV